MQPSPTNPTHPQANQQTNPHYARLGGHDAVVRLVDAFYRTMDTRDDARTIRAMHEPDLSTTKRVLVDYLSEWMGGPKRYTPSRGAPMLRRRHHPFDIDADARDAWMACMRQALAETCADAALRADLDAAFWKVADFIRNTEHGGQTRPHPGRPMDVAPHQTPPTHASTAAAGTTDVLPGAPLSSVPSPTRSL
jgi:hemoglobin